MRLMLAFLFLLIVSPVHAIDWCAEDGWIYGDLDNELLTDKIIPCELGSFSTGNFRCPGVNQTGNISWDAKTDTVSIHFPGMRETPFLLKRCDYEHPSVTPPLFTER